MGLVQVNDFLRRNAQLRKGSVLEIFVSHVTAVAGNCTADKALLQEVRLGKDFHTFNFFKRTVRIGVCKICLASRLKRAVSSLA